ATGLERDRLRVRPYRSHRAEVEDRAAPPRHAAAEPAAVALAAAQAQRAGSRRELPQALGRDAACRGTNRLAAQRAATQLRQLPLGPLRQRRHDRAGAWTPRRARNLPALPRAGEAEGRGSVLEHQPEHSREGRADGRAMNDEQLAERLDWWWRDPAKA